MWRRCVIAIPVVAIAAASVPAVAESELKPDGSIMTRDSGCDPFGCNQHCIRMGYARGVCIGSYCQCRSRKRRSLPQSEFQNIESASLKKRSFLEAEYHIPERKRKGETRASCDPYGCDVFCRKMGYKRGVCVGYCQCRTV
ncbi:unnamed protein product [Diatraea saccharalis]|uniref:Defensin n=1 Tax=Diatraea saccharalis TaxID=40085 RepID=A0A9N9R8P0_9NEOP|nr:unnamed protein product [Diatraea saccharalis]